MLTDKRNTLLDDNLAETAQTYCYALTNPVDSRVVASGTTSLPLAVEAPEKSNADQLWQKITELTKEIQEN